MKLREELQLGIEVHVCNVRAKAKRHPALTFRFIANCGHSVNRKQRLTHISEDIAPNALKLDFNKWRRRSLLWFKVHHKVYRRHDRLEDRCKDEGAQVFAEIGG